MRDAIQAAATIVSVSRTTATRASSGSGLARCQAGDHRVGREERDPGEGDDPRRVRIQEADRGIDRDEVAAADDQRHGLHDLRHVLLPADEGACRRKERRVQHETQHEEHRERGEDPWRQPRGQLDPGRFPEHERGDLAFSEERDDGSGDDRGELQEGRRADPKHLADEQLEGRGRGEDDLHHPAALLLGHALGDPVAVQDDREKQEELEREDDRSVRLLLGERTGARLAFGWTRGLDRDRWRGEEGSLLRRRHAGPSEPVGDRDRRRGLAADHGDTARVALLRVDREDGLPRGVPLDVEEGRELAVGDLRSARREVARAGHGEPVPLCVRSTGVGALRVEERVEGGHRVGPEVRRADVDRDLDRITIEGTDGDRGETGERRRQDEDEGGHEVGPRARPDDELAAGDRGDVGDVGLRDAHRSASPLTAASLRSSVVVAPTRSMKMSSMDGWAISKSVTCAFRASASRRIHAGARPSRSWSSW